MRVTIEKIISSGDGIGWAEEKTYFVPGTLPGETVEITAVEPVRRAFRATAFTVLQKAEGRREPVCPLFGRCGGCSFLHMDYPLQQRVKEGIVAEFFRQNGAQLTVAPQWVSVGELGLRTRAKVRIVGGRPAFRRRGSHEDVPFCVCPLLHPGLNEVLRADAAARSGGEIAYEYAPQDGGWTPRDAAVVKVVGGERFRVSRGSFFQASEEGAAALAALFGELLGRLRPARVLDLFCGAGLFSLFAARRGCAVTGMEQSERAAADFAVNLGGAARFVRADLDRVDALPAADLIVVDPPRTGLSPQLVAALSAAPANELCYISCDGATFVRDLGYLERQGRFTLDALTIVDQFPATRHLELFARLRRET